MIAIVGGGLAGLVCAKVLHEAGRDFLLLEASDRVGGCLRTVETNGFRLDWGFQVLLDSYPASRRHLDLAAMAPCFFESGALLWKDGEFHRVMHPLRHPRWIASSALDPAFPPADRLRLAALVGSSLLHSDAALLARCASASDESSRAMLARLGFSENVVERFFEAFFGGVFLEDALETSAGLLTYYLRKFAIGRALVPRGGIDAIPLQLAARLPPQRIRTGCAVRSIDPPSRTLVLESGESLSVDHIVLAAGEDAAARMLGDTAPAPRPGLGVTTVYFQTRRPLYTGALLVLPSGRDRLVRHLYAPTNLDPSLAPSRTHLVSATILGNTNMSEAALLDAVAAEIGEMFPQAARGLEPLRVVRIPRALPRQRPGFATRTPHRLMPEGITLADDPASPASIQSAMERGEIAAKRALSA